MLALHETYTSGMFESLRVTMSGSAVLVSLKGLSRWKVTARRRVLNVCMEQCVPALSLPSLPCVLLTDSFLQIPGPNMYLYEELLMSSPSKGASAGEESSQVDVFFQSRDLLKGKKGN